MDCSRVLTWKQYKSTCWFNAVLMAVFYSQYMRNYLYYNILPLWKADKKKTMPLYSFFVDILERRYMALDKSNKQYAYMFFDLLLKPEAILDELHKHNPRTFPVTNYDEGYLSEKYLPEFIKYLGVPQNEIITLDLDNGKLYPSIVNYKSFVYHDNKIYFDGESASRRASTPVHTPSIVIINADLVVRSRPTPLDIKDFKPKKKIKLFGASYICDSLLFGNFNVRECRMGHKVAGVTCDNKRFIYNGWMRNTIDPAIKRSSKSIVDASYPCELMPFDWMEDTSDFCLSSRNCQLKMKTSTSRMCFNIHQKNSDRNYIYIREDHTKRDAPISVRHETKEPKETKETKVTKETKATKAKTCPEGKIVNPASGRCVNITGAIGKKLIKRGG
jgi:hypothetical protein